LKLAQLSDEIARQNKELQQYRLKLAQLSDEIARQNKELQQYRLKLGQLSDEIARQNKELQHDRCVYLHRSCSSSVDNHRELMMTDPR